MSKKIGNTPSYVTLQGSKATLMYMYLFKYENDDYIVASSIDGVLFCFCPKNVLKETFQKQFTYPITSCIYNAKSKILYCGDITGQVHLFQDFPKNEFSSFETRGPQVLSSINNFVLGMYFEDNELISVHHDSQVNRWKSVHNQCISQFIQQTSKALFVLIPVFNEPFNCIVAIQQSSRPLLLKSITQLQQALAKRQQDPDYCQEQYQITDLYYDKPNRQIITGSINGFIAVYSVNDKNNYYSTAMQVKFNLVPDRIIKVRVHQNHLICLTQNKIIQVDRQTRGLVTSKQNSKMGLLQIVNDTLVLANVFDPLVISQVKPSLKAKYCLLQMTKI